MAQKWPSEDERRFWADACAHDFRLYARHAFGIGRNPKGGWWDPALHDPLCRWFQQQVEAWRETRRSGRREKRYLAVIVPRNCGKSVLITQCGTSWLHLADPSISTYIGNEKRDLAVDFLSSISEQLSGKDQHSWFEWLYGNWETASTRWKQDSIVHAARTGSRRDPSFGIWSPSSSITGRHPDYLVMDDLVSYEAMESDGDYLNFAYSHMKTLIPVVEADGMVALVGTRYADGDPFGRAFQDDGIASVSGMEDPEYVPNGGAWHVFFWSGRHPDGRPAVPLSWSDTEMRKYEKTDQVRYAFQILNKPKAVRLKPLTEGQFDSMLRPRAAMPKHLAVTISLDTAFKRLKTQIEGSENAIVAMGHDVLQKGSTWFLGAWHSDQWRGEAFLDQVIMVYRQMISRGYHVIGISDEVEVFGKSGVWEMVMRNKFADNRMVMPPFHYLSRGGQKAESKDARITSAIQMVVQGQVKFLDDAPGLATIREQLCSHPFSRRKDVADAFADTFTSEFYTAMVPLIRMPDPPRLPDPQEEALKGPEFWRYGSMSMDREPV